ncbi:LLM class flavin-dependent oxidoreductase [Gordonia desulfuricans]|uniref:LLM class flavin-dependent oxidoreductase n=1 Tax=Gordonia desulfuricans TaxID=89051 RepID=A0A7K3LQP3_9ACTN|nr:LLM class flavin-dependent oxidoreductase [Gordonia desulfuricans]NDK90565.1 LLM class flavin-dependent oxidoreductase [Gordonia desulfuricans]
MADHIHLVVALEGAGSHPGAWRAPDAQPQALTRADYWQGLIATAETGLLDFVTIPDSFALHRGHPRTDRAVGGLDAVLLASRLAPTTARIGLIPTATVTHTEPFHVSKAIATLDHISGGRAGVALRTTADPGEAGLFGRRSFPDDPSVLAVLASEATDFATVLARLWDSWEDDAEIRDVATGRFVDRDRLHYIDFVGEHFAVRGPSITPRPPQGRPIIAATGAHATDLQLIGASADVGFITPGDVDDAARAVGAIAAARTAAGRAGDAPVRVLVDLPVVLGSSKDDAAQRLEQLDAWAGEGSTAAAGLVVGTAQGLADEIERWTSVDGVDGIRLRPAALPHDLQVIVADLVPELQRRGLFRTDQADASLRERLGLARPHNHFTTRKTGVA